MKEIIFQVKFKVKGSRSWVHLSEKKPPYFPWNTGCLIGILIMVCCNPHVTGKDFITYISSKILLGEWWEKSCLATLDHTGWNFFIPPQKYPKTTHRCLSLLLNFWGSFEVAYPPGSMGHAKNTDSKVSWDVFKSFFFLMKTDRSLWNRPLKLTACPWKWMVGRRAFPF